MTRLCAIALGVAVSFITGCSSGSRMPVGQVPDAASGGMTGAGTGGTMGGGTGGMDAGSGDAGTGGMGTDGAAKADAPTTPETGPSADAADSRRPDIAPADAAPADAGPVAAGCEGCLKYTRCCLAINPSATNCTTLDLCNPVPTLSQRQGMSRDCLMMMEVLFVRPRVRLGAPVPAACQ